MTFMDFVMGWLSGIAPIPLILVLVGLGNLYHFLIKKRRSKRVDENNFRRFDNHDFR